MIVFHWIRPQLCWNLKPHVWYVMLKHQVLPCRQSNFMFQMSFCYSVWTWSCWSCWPVDMIQFQVQRSRYFGGNFLLEPCWGRHTGIPWEVLHAFLVLAFGVFVDVLWIGVRQGWDCLCSPKEKLVSVHLARHSSYVRRCLKQAAKLAKSDSTWYDKCIQMCSELSGPIGRMIAQLCLFSAGDLAFVPVAG